MKTRSIGIVLIVIGIVMMIYTGFNFVTTKNVIDAGPIQVNKEENHPVSWPPVVGAILFIGGIVLIATGKRGKIIDS